MDRNLIKEKVLSFFRQKGLEIPDSKEVEKVRYLDEGWLDSFDVIDFLTYLETEFNISFQPEELQTDSFRTIGGVIDTILRKLQ
ncbi:MAG: acyl carrier protein [Aquificota bacterium]|jgi:acyl carrier protein